VVELIGFLVSLVKHHASNSSVEPDATWLEASHSNKNSVVDCILKPNT